MSYNHVRRQGFDFWYEIEKNEFVAKNSVSVTGVCAEEPDEVRTTFLHSNEDPIECAKNTIRWWAKDILSNIREHRND